MSGWTARSSYPSSPATGEPAVLKLVCPGEEAEHEHLALQRWGGDGRCGCCGPTRRARALLLERLTGAT